MAKAPARAARIHTKRWRSTPTSSDTLQGRGRFPFGEFAINQAWLQIASIAVDVTAWLRLLALPTTLRSCEPKALRY